MDAWKTEGPPRAGTWPHVDALFADAHGGAAAGRPDAIALHFDARRHRARMLGDLLAAAARLAARVAWRGPAAKPTERPPSGGARCARRMGADVF